MPAGRRVRWRGGCLGGWRVLNGGARSGAVEEAMGAMAAMAASVVENEARVQSAAVVAMEVRTVAVAELVLPRERTGLWWDGRGCTIAARGGSERVLRGGRRERAAGPRAQPP